MNFFILIVDNPNINLQQNITYDGFIYSWPVINFIVNALNCLQHRLVTDGKNWEFFVFICLYSPTFVSVRLSFSFSE